MECNCGKPSRIHLFDKGKDREHHWCLDCTPAEYEDQVVEMRAFDEWLAGWEEEMRARRAGDRVIPSWRVPASSAFRAGWKAAMEWKTRGG